MWRFNYVRVAENLATICIMVAIFGYSFGQAKADQVDSPYHGLTENSQRRSNTGWRPHVTRFERTGRFSPVRGEQTKEQERLWSAYDGYIGPRAKASNVYRGFTSETENSEGGTDQKKAGSVTSTDLPYVKKNGHLNSNIVVMFSATWCGPCQKMYPIMRALRKEGYIVYIYTLDTDEYKKMNLGAKFQIHAYPTFVFFDHGKEVKRIVGGTDIEWFRKNLKLETEQDSKQDSDPYDGI